ncbi:MAG: VIT1/CCC1 transporter family protein [Thermoanaerobaculia bacterium]
MPAWEGNRASLERRIRAREFVFGIQDGLISNVGLLSGVSAATDSRVTVLITGIAAAVTGGLSMATGSYLASTTEKEIFEKELLDQERLAAKEPYLAQEALLESLAAEGLGRADAYRVVQIMSRREDVLLRTFQEKVLGLGFADISQPFRAGGVMFVSFLLGAAIPLAPYVTIRGEGAVLVSWASSVATLLAVGVLKGRLTGKPLLRSGLQFAAVALGSAIVGWLLGKLFDRFLA